MADQEITQADFIALAIEVCRKQQAFQIALNEWWQTRRANEAERLERSQIADRARVDRDRALDTMTRYWLTRSKDGTHPS